MRRPGRGKSPRGGAAKRAAKAGAPALRPLSASEEADLAYRKQLADQRQSQGDVEGALQALEGATPAQASRPEFRARKATLLGQRTLDQASLAVAERLFRRLAAEGVNSPQISVNFANVLMKLGKIEQAEKLLRAAQAADPDLPGVDTDLGSLHIDLGEWRAAEGHLLKALEKDPENDRARSCLADVRLGLGEFETGWALYWSRLAKEGRRKPPTVVPAQLPLWDGAGPAPEPTLLWREQGVGEQILFAGLAEEYAEKIAPLGLLVDSRLAPLIGRSLTSSSLSVFSVDDAPADALDAYRRQGPMGALGPAVRPSRASFSAPPKAYLRADPARRQEMAAWLDSLGPGPNIGISWRSSMTAAASKKSVPIGQWGPVLRCEGLRFVDLQYGPTEEERAEAQRRFGAEIASHPTLDRKDDFDGVAALISELDAVVTSSNAVAHLAGALGAEMTLMLPKSHFWYWGFEAGVACRWYPNVETFRRADPGHEPRGWSPATQAVGRRLKERFAA